MHINNNILCVAWKRIQAVVDAPPANFRRDDVGRSRQVRLFRCGGPSQVEESRANARQSRVSQPDALTHSKVDKLRLQYRLLAWRSPPNGDRRCSSHLSHHQVKMYEEHKCTASPSPQFALPQRGRKRLSREATLHTELALEWPELVQIGRCKVQWLPNVVKKRILTSF